MRRQRRRAIAAACVALVVVAAVLPLGGMSLEWLAVAPPLVGLLVAQPQTVRPRPTSDSAGQPRSLLAILDSRGPPCSTLV
jgi:hypothetical protein